MEEKNKLAILVDFRNFMFTSGFHKPLLNSKGQNVNAIKNFFQRIKSILEAYRPSYVVFGNDLSREQTFRRQLYPEYKGNRKSHDESIIFQMDQALELITLLGFPILADTRFEADDLLGMTSRFLNEQDTECIIFSTDRDLYQLITPCTYIATSKTPDLIDLDKLDYMYQLTPEQWIDFKILVGDKSDNIPGIRGIGESSALKLLHKYGSVSGIYENIRFIEERFYRSLQDFKMQEPLIRKLVTIVTDYSQISLTNDMLRRREPMATDIFGRIQELEIPSLYDTMHALMSMNITES